MTNSPREGLDINLAFVGDVCLGKSVRETLRSMGAAHPLAKVRDILASADIASGNLECILSSDCQPGKTPDEVMIVPTSLIDETTLHPFKVLGLANNHTMDGGVSGLSSTMKFLAENRFVSFGAGRDLQSAESCRVVEVRGLRIAFLGACDVPKCYASASRPGVAPLNSRRLENGIKAAKAVSDIVIVVLHADLEFTHYPSPNRVRMSRRLIDAGAGAVIQHHPHVCQGIEYYRHGLIAYSLGNFVFPLSHNPYVQSHEGTDWGLILFLNVRRESAELKLSFNIEPVTIGEDDCPAPSVGKERDAQIKIIEQISRDLGNRGLIRRYWRSRCFAEAKATYYVLAHVGRRKGVLAMCGELAKLLLDPYERRWMYGLMTAGFLG